MIILRKTAEMFLSKRRKEKSCDNNSQNHAIINVIVFVLTLGIMITATNPAFAQRSQQNESYPVGNPLGLPLMQEPDVDFEQISSNVKVYGAIHSAESCIYDSERELIILPSRGMPQNIQENDSWISLINHDGSVNTPRWIGIQNPEERSNLSPALVLNDPLGSAIANGILYVADLDGGASSDAPTVAVIRRFDLKTGAPMEGIRIEESPWLNDIAVTEDGTIYTTQTGDLGENPDPQSFRVWKVSPEGDISVFAIDKPLRQPNGIDFDPDGNIVVVNYGNEEILTFSKEGKLLKTETVTQPGGDGLVIMPDGTKYVCSVTHGGVFRIRPGEPAELIAENIPSAASMCYDSGKNQLVIPMTSQSTIAIISLD